ncbi:unannotated protein [freshwater metagenome]|uniref:Unannotated protein n=1 Tax=freshwater metagenome TaxID=449393 RepID=A0A6J7FH75_9ZZZZ
MFCGYESPPGRMSFRSVVPSAVPSDVHSSLPCEAPVPRKMTRSPIRVSS